MTQIPFTPFTNQFGTPFGNPFGNPFAVFNPFNLPLNTGFTGVPGSNTPLNGFAPFNQVPGGFHTGYNINTGYTNGFNVIPFNGFGGFQGVHGYNWNTPLNVGYGYPQGLGQGVGQQPTGPVPFAGVPNIPFGFVPLGGAPFVNAFSQDTGHGVNGTQNTTGESAQNVHFGYAVPFNGIPFGFVGYQNGVQNGPVGVKAA